jgi:hypothetical protein
MDLLLQLPVVRVAVVLEGDFLRVMEWMELFLLVGLTKASLSTAASISKTQSSSSRICGLGSYRYVLPPLLPCRALGCQLLRRRLNELPGRPELAQYEQRFVELAHAVGWKLEETRRFFSQYNAAAESLRVLQAELALLNKLRTQYEAVRGADENTRTAFVASMAAAAQGVQDSLRKQEDKLTKEKGALAEAQQAQAQALQRNRAYAAVLAALQQEVARGEELRQRLEALSVAPGAVE